jgi:hypothetical protein
MDILKQFQLVQRKTESENFIEGFGVKVLAGLMRMVHFFAPDKGLTEFRKASGQYDSRSMPNTPYTQ